MQAIKITIAGSFWDSFLYNGQLFLFNRDGSIKTVNWDMFGGQFKLAEYTQLVFDIAYKRSYLLYNPENKVILKDREMKATLWDKFQKLRERELIIEKNDLECCPENIQENPLPFPHSDIEIYYRKIYASSKSGIFSAGCNKKTKHPISTRSQKLWDCPSLNIAANYGNLAIAAGNEGTYEVEVAANRFIDWHRYDEPRKMSKHHCSAVDWNFYSIYSSSSISNGYLIYQEQTEEEDYMDNSFPENNFVSSDQIFGVSGYSWGSNDKIYLYNNNERSLFVKKFNPFDNRKPRYIDLNNIPFQEWKGDIVSAKVATFGTIIELDNAIVVVRSDGKINTIEGEPVHWRVFPRSHNYENQLHIIYEDHLDIYSFNHDPFIDQDSKNAGYKFRRRRR